MPAIERSSLYDTGTQKPGDWAESQMKVEALNDYTVQFTLPAPFAPFLRSLSASIYPKHILEKHVDAGTFYYVNEEDSAVHSVWDIDTNPTEIVGTGPFTISEYTPPSNATDALTNNDVTTSGSGQLVLKRNPNYWLQDDAGNFLPYLDEVVYTIVEDLDEELERFKSGASDYIGIRGADFKELKTLGETNNFTIHNRGPGFGTTFLAFNVNPGVNSESNVPYLDADKLSWFSNKEFRQAVAHTVNKAKIIDEIQHGLAYPQWSSVSPSAGDFHNPNVQQYEYDLDKASQMLDCLGWVDTDEDGVREDDEGNPIEFSLVTNDGNDVRMDMAELLSENLQQIGINAQFKTYEFADLVDSLTNTYDWEAIVIGFTGSSDPYSGISFWHSSESMHMWHPNQEQPATDWENRIDDLYVKGSQELNSDKRVDYYHQAQEIVAENVPVIYTTLPERLNATRNVFGNLTPTLYGMWDMRYLYRTDVGE